MNEFLASAHPFIVHFAVALTMMSAAFELLAAVFRKQHLATTALSVAIAAVPFLLAAVLTGNLAEAQLNPALHSATLAEHIRYANITVWIFTALVFTRVYLGLKGLYSTRLKLLYLVLLCALAAVVFLTAQRGGSVNPPAQVETRR